MRSLRCFFFVFRFDVLPKKNFYKAWLSRDDSEQVCNFREIAHKSMGLKLCNRFKVFPHTCMLANPHEYQLIISPINPTVSKVVYVNLAIETEGPTLLGDFCRVFGLEVSLIVPISSCIPGIYPVCNWCITRIIISHNSISTYQLINWDAQTYLPVLMNVSQKCHKVVSPVKKTLLLNGLWSTPICC